MSYLEIKGNLFNSNADAYVNTVNCRGVMGKGIALEFRRRYPAMFYEYKRICEGGELVPGQIWKYKSDGKWVLNFAVKDHWKYPSRIDWVEKTLKQFCLIYKQIGIRSIAFPVMGAMNGKLPIDEVRSLMKTYLEPLTDLTVEVYDFDPDAEDQLFLCLKTLILNNNTEKLFMNIKMPSEKRSKLINYIMNQKIKSMAGIDDYRLLGATSIDKLYLFLTELLKTGAEENLKKHKDEQLALFS